MNLRSSGVRFGILLTCCIATSLCSFGQDAATTDSDNPVWASFKQLQKLPAYHTRITMQSADPRMAQAAAMGLGFGTMEKTVKGDTTQVVMHMKMPSVESGGVADDWEIRAVVQNGRAARMFSSPAIPRLRKKQEQSFAMQMAMLNAGASMAIAEAAAQGPWGAARAGMLAAETVAFDIMAARELKKAEEFWDWKCLDKPANAGSNSPPQLSDIKSAGDENVNGVAAAAYEFYVTDGGQRNGPVRLLVAKDSGLPMRIHINDPAGRGNIDMDYDFAAVGEIEIPKCLAKTQ